jgi:hypothetical protein
MCPEPFDGLRAHVVSHAAWDVGAVPGVHAMHSVSDLGTAFDKLRGNRSTGLGRNGCCGLGRIQRPRRAVPKMLRTISVPAVRANCLNALEPVICSTMDFSRRCGVPERVRAAARASRSA